MIIKSIILMMAPFIIVLGLCGFGYADSKIPLIIDYELSFDERAYTSHSVTLDHAMHAMKYKISCIRCHHTLEEDTLAVKETCKDCHSNTELRSFPQAESIPEEKRMEHYFLAIHDQCINCHKEVRKSDEWTTAPVGSIRDRNNGT